MPKRLATCVVLPILTFSLAGCFEHFGDQIVDAFVHGPDRGLLIAVYSYREGAGRWPASPEVLKKSDYLQEDLHLDRYKNLTFQTLADGRLVIAFDSYTSPDGSVTWSKTRMELGEPAVHPPTTQAQSRIDDKSRLNPQVRWRRLLTASA